MRLPSDQVTFEAMKQARMAALGEQLGALATLSHPVRTWEGYVKQRTKMDAVLAAGAPKGLAGTVGAVPWDLAEIIAAGYTFVPQPSLQQYSSYTDNLQHKDAAHFAGKNWPGQVLLQFEDDR